MDRHRQIAFIAAFIVALVIMMIGKACTDKMVQQKNVRNNPSQTTPSYDNNSYNNNYNNNYNNSYGNTPQQTEAPVQTVPPVEYVTNMFGEVVGTAAPVVTDIPATDFEEVQTTTQQRSILEQYNENKNQNQNQNNSQNHDSYSPPSEIKITIH